MGVACIKMSTGDKIYRTVFSTIKFFSKGWGPIETAESLAKVMTEISQASCAHTISHHSHPITTKKMADNSEGVLYEGTFTSPLATLLPGVLPVESEAVRFELLLPKEWKGSAKPLYIHMAGTGDHYYWRRRYLFAFPLLKSGGIGSLILENPYYGTRKPRNQSRSQLHYVTDLFVMGLALIHESMVLGNWLEESGLGPVGLTGISMGGHNCSLSASLWSKPVPTVPCLSLVTASPVFTQGAFKTAVQWEELERQLLACKLGQDERRRHVFDMILSRYGQPDLLTLMNQYEIEEGQSTKVKRSQTTPRPVTLQIMKHVLDYSTHFHNYPKPISPELVTFLPAKDDLYMPHQMVEDFREIWPGCNVNYINGGHVTSFLLQRKNILKAQIEQMDRFLISTQHGSLGNRNESLA